MNQKNTKYAFYIGGLCSFSYMAVYIARSILSTVTPQLVESGISKSEHIGMISSAFFVMYAVGQLSNGILGDRVKGKYMVTMGLLIGALFNWLLCEFIGHQTVAIWMYGMQGFFLSMIYAPMVKTISENTHPLHAEKCNVALAFAAYSATPAAGLIAGVCTWKNSFRVVSIIMLFMGVLYFVLMNSMEKVGIIKYRQFENRDKSQERKQKDGITVLIQRRIILFTMVSALTGIVRTAVVFWLPTYIFQYLGFSTGKSAILFSLSTAGISLSSFVAVFVYERLHRNVRLTLILCFGVAVIGFAALYFVKLPYLNVLLITLAVMASNCASNMIWVVYCPSFWDTGMVSTVTGYLNFVSYLAGAVSNVLFANAVSTVGWKNLILIWAALMGVGVVLSIPEKK